jgi:hypothetical protein
MSATSRPHARHCRASAEAVVPWRGWVNAGCTALLLVRTDWRTASDVRRRARLEPQQAGCSLPHSRTAPGCLARASRWNWRDPTAGTAESETVRVAESMTYPLRDSVTETLCRQRR